MEDTLSPSLDSTVGQMLASAVERWGARIALRRRREPLRWSVLSWTELGLQVRSLAAGLLDIGVEPGDRVALLSRTRLEWSLLDYATLSVGAVTVPIYHSSTAGQASYVLRDSGARVLVVEDGVQLAEMLRLVDDFPDLEKIVVIDVMDLRSEPRAILMDELAQAGRRLLREKESLLDEAIQAVQSDWLATIVYSSGTTGRPKGARLTHRNLLAAVRALHGVLDVGEDDTTVLCLPLSHIYGRLGQYSALSHGFCIAYARRVDLLTEVLQEVRPTFFFGVPRLYERIYHRVVTGYREMPPLLQGVVRRGVESARGAQAPEESVDGEEPGALGRLVERVKRFDVAHRLAAGLNGTVAEKTIFEPVRQSLGGRVRFCLSGGAPLNPDIARFFRLAGVEVLEGYGLTETGGATTVNLPHENRIGTVGRPLPGVRIRVAADGEILVKGDVVFSGYHNQADETALVLDEEGWLHTGDLGHLDEAGFLVVTDRKKDLIITSGAKNVAPQQVEATLRMSPYISDVMVFGDRRPYLVALLTLEPGEVTRFGEHLDLPGDDWPALLREPRIQQLVEAEVERCNDKLAGFEQVRRFRVLQRQLTVEGGELTPTLKVRRRAVGERYRPLIEAMYSEGPLA